MKYKNNRYLIEKVKVDKIANRYGTPIYCYSYNKLKENIKFFKSNFKSFTPLICFAVKANSNLNILKEIKKFGLGADVVSRGELMKALKAGINPKKIVFSGVGKTYSELRFAIDKKILLINSESKSEVLEIEKIAKSRKKKVNIGVRLNPNIDPKTLKQISTGKKENKFGVNEKIFIELFNYIKNSKYLNLKCLSVHIGSQITDHRPYEKMLKALDKLIIKINFNFEFIDLGGGIGISYKNHAKKFNYKKYNDAIKKFVKKHKVKIIFEPGRSIIGNAGILVSRVIYIKKNYSKNFIILDAGMNDLMRPALYNAKHDIMPATRRKGRFNKTFEFVGPICETTDKFLTLNNFQKLNEKDLIIISDVGAYGSTLSSNYNVRPKPAEILVKSKKIYVLQKRQELKNIV